MNLKDCWKPLSFITEIDEPPLKDGIRDIKKSWKEERKRWK